jgi:hypothetical protein
MDVCRSRGLSRYAGSTTDTSASTSWRIATRRRAADSGTYWRGGKLSPTKKHPRRARLVAPTLAVDSEYVCRTYYPFGVIQGTAARTCATESSGEWTGALERTPVDYKSCGEGAAEIDYVNNQQDTEAGISEGVTFRSEVSAEALGTALGFSTQYGSDTFLVYRFDRTRKKRRFCLGGNGTSVRDSSRLYITSVKPGTPSCDPPGPATCPHPNDLGRA